jgi:hypothetical protein
VRVLPHIGKLDDCFGQFLRAICVSGAWREIEAEALERLAGWSVTLKQRAPAGAVLDVRVLRGAASDGRLGGIEIHAVAGRPGRSTPYHRTP